MFVCFLFVFLSILFRVAWWSFADKELSSWLSACAVLLYAILNVCVHFPFGVYGRMRNLIVSVADHCLFVYFSKKFWLLYSLPKQIIHDYSLHNKVFRQKYLVLTDYLDRDQHIKNTTVRLLRPRRDNLGVILVRMCGPTFPNPPHPYT